VPECCTAGRAWPGLGLTVIHGSGGGVFLGVGAGSAVVVTVSAVGLAGSPQVVGRGIAFAMNDFLSLVSDGAFCVSEFAFTAGFTELAHGEQGGGS
jgi:hypothetical protein